MEDDGVENLGVLSRTLVIEGLKGEALPKLTLDFDGSVLTTKGHAEGTAVGFNKQKKRSRSYYPLFCTVAQTSQFFDLHHRPGNVRDSYGAVDYMINCFKKARHDLQGVILESQMDSAFFTKEILTARGDQHIKFSVFSLCSF